MKTFKSKTIAVIAVCTIIGTIVIFNSGAIGISADRIESDARKSSQVNDNWEVSISTNDKLCAMIFYSGAHDKYMYQVYINRDGLSFGYFFLEGGADADIMAKGRVPAFEYTDYGSALVSMNKDGISKIEIDNGVDGIKIMNIDSQKPFAVVLPENVGSVTLYNAEGVVIPLSLSKV